MSRPTTAGGSSPPDVEQWATGSATTRQLLLVATAGAALFLVCLVAVELSGRLAPLDAQALSVGREVAGAVPRAAVHAVTDLGAFPSTATLVAVAALALVALGRPRPAIALLVGFLAILVTVGVLKTEVGRLRPPGHEASLAAHASFPSGHAAYSTAWAAVALALTRARAEALARTPTGLRAALVAVAALVTVAVGMTRIVLSDHYLSDVLGGWGLGTALFAAAGAVLVAIGAMRHTAGDDEEGALHGRTETTA